MVAWCFAWQTQLGTKEHDNLFVLHGYTMIEPCSDKNSAARKLHSHCRHLKPLRRALFLSVSEFAQISIDFHCCCHLTGRFLCVRTSEACVVSRLGETLHGSQLSKHIVAGSKNCYNPLETN